MFGGTILCPRGLVWKRGICKMIGTGIEQQKAAENVVTFKDEHDHSPRVSIGSAGGPRKQYHGAHAVKSNGVQMA